MKVWTLVTAPLYESHILAVGHSLECIRVTHTHTPVVVVMVSATYTHCRFQSAWQSSSAQRLSLNHYGVWRSFWCVPFIKDKLKCTVFYTHFKLLHKNNHVLKTVVTPVTWCTTAMMPIATNLHMHRSLSSCYSCSKRSVAVWACWSSLPSSLLCMVWPVVNWFCEWEVGGQVL